MVLGSTSYFKYDTFDHSVIYPLLLMSMGRLIGLRRFERLLEPS
jgi:hypothetical protein